MEASDLAVQAATKILRSYKERIIEYFNDFKGTPNVLYKDFLVDVQVMPEEMISFIVEVPFEKGKKGQYFSVEVDFKCPLKAMIKLKDFPIENVFVEIQFPKIFLGEKGAFPKIIISCQTKKGWFGDFGLAWLPLTGSNEFRFHPFENKNIKSEEIQNFYIDNIVDPLCDFLNTSDNYACTKLKRKLKEFLTSKRVEVLSYRSPFNKKFYNTIEVPLYCEYSESSDTSVMYFECYIVQKYWMQPADVIMNFLQHISTITNFFDSDGELIESTQIINIESEMKSYEAREEELAEERRIVEVKETWDPFKPVKTTQRDEFGFLVDSGDDGFASKEASTTFESIQKVKEDLEKRKVQAQKIEKREVKARTSSFTDENAWYNAFKGFQFEVVGTGAGLDFRKKGDFRILESLNPRKIFILSFGRDALRNQFSVTSMECAKKLFDLFLSGHIRVVN